MLRVVALSCLVLSALAVPLESDSPQARSGGGIQKYNSGKRVAGDKLIWSGSGSQMIDFARTITVELPFPAYGLTNNAVITEIVATTSLDSGSTQYTMQSGGVGQKSFNLKLVTTGAHKVSYKFEVYGKE